MLTKLFLDDFQQYHQHLQLQKQQRLLTKRKRIVIELQRRYTKT